MAKQKYVARHRNAPPRPRRSRLLSSAIVATAASLVTGLFIAAGVLVNHDGVPDLVAADAAVAATIDFADRVSAVSRSSGDRRDQSAGHAADLVAATTTGEAVTRSEDISVADPRGLARALMPQYGLKPSEFGCLDPIWTQESNWNVHAANPRSSAYGIPQALPGSKMASAGPDWRHNAETQIRWGLKYIKDRYGSACDALSFKKRRGWY